MVEFVYYFSLRWACVLKVKPDPDEVAFDNVKDDKNKKIIIVKEFENADVPTVSGGLSIFQR